MQNAIVSDPVPIVSHETFIQPEFPSKISDDSPFFGKIHYKLDYDFGSSKVRSLLYVKL